MPFANNERDLVKDLAVDLDLEWKALQCIRVALDLVTVEESVDNCNVCPTLAMKQSKFIKHQRISVLSMVSKYFLVNCSSHIAISVHPVGSIAQI